MNSQSPHRGKTSSVTASSIALYSRVSNSVFLRQAEFSIILEGLLETVDGEPFMLVNGELDMSVPIGVDFTKGC